MFWKIPERADEGGELERVPLVRTYTVFNAEQCEGIAVPELQARSFNAIQAAQAILDGIPGAPADDRARRQPGSLQRRLRPDPAPRAGELRSTRGLLRNRLP